MKKLLWVIAALVLLSGGALIALVTLVNPNQFKPQIEQQVYQQTGLELQISGDIGWQFFPTLGFEMGQTQLKNPAGFDSDNLLSVERVSIDVSLLPLMNQTLNMGDVVLDNAQINIETLSDGQRNIDALTSKASDPEAQNNEATTKADSQSNSDLQNNSDAQSGETGWQIRVAGVHINQAALSIIDKQAGSSTRLENLSLALSEFAFDQWSQLSFSGQGQQNAIEFDFEGQTEFKISADLSDYQLKDTRFEANVDTGAQKLEALLFTMNEWQVGQSSPFNLSLKGQADDTEFDVNLGGELTLPQEFNSVTLSQLSLTGQLNGQALPVSPMSLEYRGGVRMDLDSQHIIATLDRLGINDNVVSGQVDVNLDPELAVKFVLNSDKLNLDQLTGADNATNETSQSEANSASSSKTAATQEPDLSGLQALNLNGQVNIKQLQANNILLNDVALKLKAANGVVNISSFKASMYEGSLAMTAQLDGRKTPASYQTDVSVKGVQMLPLLKAVAQQDVLEGKTTINAKLTGRSLIPDNAMQNLTGDVAIQLDDGAVNGINVAKMLRTGYAKYTGQDTSEASEVQSTDFSSLSASFDIAKGVASSDDIQMYSPLLRLLGEGDIAFVKQTLAMKLNTSLVGSLQGQGGKSADELKDLTIPLKISGEFTDPKIGLDFSDALKQKANKEVERGVEKLTDKIKDEDTKQAVDGLLKGLFN